MTIGYHTQRKWKIIKSGWNHESLAFLVLFLRLWHKTNASKESDIRHSWCSLDRNFEYEPYICNGYHDLIQKAVNFNDVAIVSVKGSYYIVPFWYMSKDDAINIMNNSNLNEKSGCL